MKYWLYGLVFALFATIAAIHGHFLSVASLWPEWVGGLVVFLLMTIMLYRWFWQLDRPYRQEWREALLMTLVYGSAAIGLLVAVINDCVTLPAESPWHSSVIAMGYFALWTAGYVVLRLGVVEKSDPKTCRRGGGCCGGHHH